MEARYDWSVFLCSWLWLVNTDCATAMGQQTIASGRCSTAVGQLTTGSSGVSIAMGAFSSPRDSVSTGMDYITAGTRNEFAFG